MLRAIICDATTVGNKNYIQGYIINFSEEINLNNPQMKDVHVWFFLSW